MEQAGNFKNQNDMTDGCQIQADDVGWYVLESEVGKKEYRGREDQRAG